MNNTNMAWHTILEKEPIFVDKKKLDMRHKKDAKVQY